MTSFFGEQLQALRDQSLYRQLREIEGAQGAKVKLAGKELVNFSSNDYLGLANDSRLRQAAVAALDKFGLGAGASRLISGTQSPHVRLETAVAAWKRTEAVLCFSSGYAAALGTIPALVTKDDVILLDKLCHASLIDGAKLSGAVLRVFPHNGLTRLERQLEWAQRTHPKARLLIVTESVFSMDGDRAPLRKLIELKNHFKALLFVDEAHAVGVIGPNGRGLAAEEEIDHEVDVQMGTLSKALGASGGYICGSGTVVDWLINRARSFIFSTAPPAAVAAAATTAVNFVNSPEGEQRRQILLRNIDLLRKNLPPAATGKNWITNGSAIFPWMVGEVQAAVDLSAALAEEGFLVPAIRYPTVSKGSARLRITVTATHTDVQLQALCTALRCLTASRCRTPYGVREEAQ